MSREQKQAYRRLLYQRQGGMCADCGKACDSKVPPQSPLHAGTFTLDHIVSRNNGGDDSPDNLRGVCQDCNMKKGMREKNHPVTVIHNSSMANILTIQLPPEAVISIHAVSSGFIVRTSKGEKVFETPSAMLDFVKEYYFPEVVAAIMGGEVERDLGPGMMVDTTAQPT